LNTFSLHRGNKAAAALAAALRVKTVWAAIPFSGGRPLGQAEVFQSVMTGDGQTLGESFIVEVGELLPEVRLSLRQAEASKIKFRRRT
jgi:hypothetical protein